MAYKEKGKCVICGGEYSHWGNNASPIKTGRCCDKCNDEVIMARIAKIRKATGVDKKDKAKEQLFKAIYGAMIDVRNNDLTGEEIVTIAFKTIAHFAKKEGMR